MFAFFKKLAGIQVPPKVFFSPSHGEQATNQHLEVFSGEEPGDLALTRYPPFDKGIPLIEIETLMRSQDDLVTRIFRTAGVSREEFSERYMPPIRNLALHVHLLPATSTTYFRGTGGLFRMSLEVALNALQTANAAVFPISGGVERRFYIQPKWSLAVFLAGLCSQNYRTMNSMVVISRDNKQWAPLLDHLYDWATSSQIDRYHVRWLEDSPVSGAKATSSYSINHIVPPDVLQFLASDNNQIVQAMTADIAGVDTNASENPITRIVAPIITRVIEEDLNRSATNYGHLVIGAHLEPHLVDAMRRLVRGGKWVPNQPGGRVWVGREGVFIDWVDAAADISLLLAKDSFAGVPKDPDTLAELLINAGLLEMQKGKEKYWTIAIPVTLEARDSMVKLRQGVSILGHHFDYAPFQSVQLTLVAPPPLKAKPKEGPTKQRTEPQLEESRPEVSQERAGEKAAVKPNPPATKASPGTPPPPAAPPDEELISYREDFQPPEIYDTGGMERCGEAPPLEDSGPIASPTGSPSVPEPSMPEKRAERQGKKPAAESKRQVSASFNAGERLLGSLQGNNAAIFKSLLTKFGQNGGAGIVFFLPNGVGIAHTELNALGQPVMELFEELSAKQWLWIDKTKPSRKIHSVELDGEVQRLMILKADIATGLGFVQST